MLTSGPRGTKDILPSVSGQWQYIEGKIREICNLFSYKEIRTPIFEHTELFLRGIGDTTDIVEKEMYTFTDRGERSLTLRPENTAAVVRAYLENKLYADNQLAKLFYIGPMFRYDRPQAGRYRQFHQFGIEAIGLSNPAVDAEIITLAVQFLQKLGLTELNLQLNSVGCPKCRPVYREKLQEFLQDKVEDLCNDCKSRYDRNPMRILDCKNEKCTALSQGAPEMIECLCDDCGTHFNKLKELLTTTNISYNLNPRLVRGLDYYTKTAFEIQYPPLGAQSAVCGGGRYDGLIGECGGNDTPAIGFAIGIERVLLALEKQNLLPDFNDGSDVFILQFGEVTESVAFNLMSQLRANGLKAEMDFSGRSFKAQMKQANKLNAKYVIIVGEDEVAQNVVTLKNMANSQQEVVAVENIIDKLKAEVKG